MIVLKELVSCYYVLWMVLKACQTHGHLGPSPAGDSTQTFGSCSVCSSVFLVSILTVFYSLLFLSLSLSLSPPFILSPLPSLYLSSRPPAADDEQWTAQRRDTSTADVQWSPSTQDISLISEDYFPIYFVAPGTAHVWGSTAAFVKAAMHQREKKWNALHIKGQFACLPIACVIGGQ